MTKISRISPDPRHMGIFVDNFWNAVTLLENKEETKKFLKDLLTHTETKMFAKRIQIAKMLMQGYDYRAIRNYVKVTNTTIAKVNNLLNTKGENLKLIIGRIIHLEKKRQRKIEGEDQSIIPAGPMRLLPDLVELGINVADAELKKRNKRKSVQVEPLKL